MKILITDTKLGLFNMEKNIPLSLQGDLTAALQYLKGADEKEGEGLFVVTGKRGMVLN